MNSPKPKRRWLQFSIRSLLLITLLIGLWLGYEVRQARFVARSTAEIAGIGGKVECESAGWSLLKFVDRRKYGLRIVKAEIPGQAVGNAIERLQSLPDLREVCVRFDGTYDIQPSWALVNGCLPGVNILAAAQEDGTDAMGESAASIPGRRLERFRAKVKEGSEAVSDWKYLGWNRWQDRFSLRAQKYHVLVLTDGTLAEVLVLEQGISLGRGTEETRAVLLARDRCVGVEELSTGRDDVVIKDLDGDGVSELGFEFHGHGLDRTYNERTGSREFSFVPLRYWSRLYKLEPTGFQSILPASSADR